MSSDFLNRILSAKRVDNERKRAYRENLRRHLDQSEYPRYSLFKQRISQAGQVNLIAEVKKASPSKGVIREDFDPEAIARVYEKAGAVAISVLTEEEYFQGKSAYLQLISGKAGIPTLMKDFVVDELQVYEGRYCGASAVLLIVAALSDAELRYLLGVARRLDVDALVEVHDDTELDRALLSGAEIIGINNRDLHTFKVDIATSERLIPRIPKDRVTVAESGISTHAEIKRLAAAGAHAVLIGETFLRERDIAGKIREVMLGGDLK
ncbi:MAG: indole-3-glycerol phosphate synthase TrpC [Candidatus Omnitrophica bacterium]|nr:indole-3-glycerol phosphate synthase TrpC [Candidatus Omnitrophota bacterium]